MHSILALSILVLSQNANAAPQTETAQPPKTGDPTTSDLAFVLDLSPNLPQEWRNELEQEALTSAQRKEISLRILPMDSKEVTVIGGCRVMNAACSQGIMDVTKSSRLILMQVQITAGSTVVGCDIVDRNGVTSKPLISISDRGGLGLNEAKQFLRGILTEEANKLKEAKQPKKAADPWASAQAKPVLPEEPKKIESKPSPLKPLLWPMAFVGGLASAAGVVMLAIAVMAFGGAWMVNISTAFPMPNETQRKYYDRREGSVNLIGTMMLGTVMATVIGSVTLVIGLAAGGSAGGIALVP